MLKRNCTLFVAAWIALVPFAACGGDSSKNPFDSLPDAADAAAGGSPAREAGVAGMGPDAGGNAAGGAGGAAGSRTEAGVGGTGATGEIDSGLDAPVEDVASGGSSGGPADAAEDRVDAGEDPDAGGRLPLALTVSPELDRRAISPYIYGANRATAGPALSATVARLGGTALSGYNWEINATNRAVEDRAGQLNIPFGSGSSPGSAAAEVIAVAQDNAGMAVLTVPIGDYVAADALGDDVLQTPNHLATRFKQNVAVKGAALSLSPDTTDAFVYQNEFVNWAMMEAGTTPVTFSLDNEPSIWEIIHPAFHPTKATYDDVVDRGIAFARAIKDVWPEAAVSGPVSYGWLGAVNLQESPDEATKGDFLEYYLSQMAAVEAAEGRRLVDYLDLHWYPEARGGGIRIIADDSSPPVAAARVQAPRSLWDESYYEDSWIIDDILRPMGQTIQLIPRLKSKIAERYPGTRLAISQWAYGGGADISGAVATADVLGIFGREGVDLAAVDLADQSEYTVAAFEAFLNYDGNGGRFGDTSVRAITNDLAGSSVYASINANAETELVIIAINKRDTTRNAAITISGGAAYSSCDVWELTRNESSVLAGSGVSSIVDNTFDYTMPAMSVAVLIPRM